MCLTPAVPLTLAIICTPSPRCDQVLNNALTSTFGVGMLVLTLLSSVCLVVGWTLRRRLAQWIYIVHKFLCGLTLLTKLKILVGFSQIVIKIEPVYDVYLPAEVRAVIRRLRIVVSLGIEVRAPPHVHACVRVRVRVRVCVRIHVCWTFRRCLRPVSGRHAFDDSQLLSCALVWLQGVPLECIGAQGYRNRLLLWTVAPLALVAVVVLAVALDLCLRSDRRLTCAALFCRVIPVVLRLGFLVYPIVTNVAFEAFSCFEFEDGRSWLRTDVAIECETPPHSQAKRLAAIAIAVYPVGLFFLNAALLFHVRKALYSGTETALSRPLRFLYAEYDRHVFWWELMELGRRFVLVLKLPVLSLRPHSPTLRADVHPQSMFDHTITLLRWACLSSGHSRRAHSCRFPSPILSASHSCASKRKAHRSCHVRTTSWLSRVRSRYP